MTDEEFAKEYATTDDLKAMAERLGISYMNLAQKASRLRKRGYDIKRPAPTTEYYRRIGSIGGKNGRTGGFYVRRDLASQAGKRGGRISRRVKNER